MGVKLENLFLDTDVVLLNKMNPMVRFFASRYGLITPFVKDYTKPIVKYAKIAPP